MRGWFWGLDVEEYSGTLLLQAPQLVGERTGSPWGLWASPLSGLWGGGSGEEAGPLSQQP